MKRNIPFSKEKENRQGIVLFWKAKIRKLKGGVVDKDIICRREKLYQINCSEEITLDATKEKLKVAKEKWKELITKGKEIREKDLLGYHQTVVLEETQEQ